MAKESKQIVTKAGRPPRVLILCAVDFTVRRFLVPLAQSLSESGCDVRIGCTPGPYWNGLVDDGLKMVRIPVARSWNVLLHLVTAVRLWSYLRREQIDILHVHTPIAGLIGRIVGRLAGVPIILYTAHGFYFHDRMSPTRRRFHIFLERLGARFHHHLFLVSEEDAQTAEQLGIELPSRTTVVRNGVDSIGLVPERLAPGRARTRRELGIPADAPVAILVGRLTREKGFVEFLRAARRVRRRIPNAHFLLVGGSLAGDRSPIATRVRQMASDPRLADCIHALGFREDVPELLAASDLFVLPSHREGLPVSVLEAMVLGLPVVATNIRGCREAVADGSSGFLVEPGHAHDLASAMAYLFKHPDMAQRMGLAGRRRALEQYDLAGHLEAQWNVYERLIAERLA